MGFLEFAGFCLLNDIESNHVLLSFDIDLNFVETWYMAILYRFLWRATEWINSILLDYLQCNWF